MHACAFTLCGPMAAERDRDCCITQHVCIASAMIHDCHMTVKLVVVVVGCGLCQGLGQCLYSGLSWQLN